MAGGSEISVLLGADAVAPDEEVPTIPSANP